MPFVSANSPQLTTISRYPVPQRAETQGRTEEYIGQWLKQAQVPRDRVVVATKVSDSSFLMCCFIAICVVLAEEEED